MRENDVVALLLRQHEEIRRLFSEVETSSGAARADAFERLRRFLAVHETAAHRDVAEKETQADEARRRAEAQEQRQREEQYPGRS